MVSDPFSSHLSYLDDAERSVERFLLDTGRDRLSAAELMAPELGPEPTLEPGRSPPGGTWTVVSVPGVEVTARLLRRRQDGGYCAPPNPATAA
jgi:hypothetical protein